MPETRSITAPSSPSSRLRYAARRLRTIENARKRRDNEINALLRREMGVTSNKEVSSEDRAMCFATWIGAEQGIKPNDDFLDQMERRAIKDIEEEVTNGPWKDFVDQRNGVGYKSFGRVLAVIGDPIWLTLDAEGRIERTVGQLFQYAGVGDPDTSKRRKGQRATKNVHVGPPLFNLAETSGVKCRTGPHYREVYDAAKAAKEGWLHTKPCAQCGTKSQAQQENQDALTAIMDKRAPRLKNDVWAIEGTPWKAGHLHGHGMRMVKRAILRDIWEFAHEI